MAGKRLRLVDLPMDVAEEIFSRVPTTSLGQLQSICKRWSRLFKDPIFIKKHLDKTRKQNLVLMLKDYSVYTTSFSIPGNYSITVDPTAVEPSPTMFERKLSLNDHMSEQVSIFDVFHCDGLLLCTTKYNRVVVWNPINGQTRWIQPTNGNKTHSNVALGYVNKNSCRSYKIMRCWDSHHGNETTCVRFEIYDFSSDSWRVPGNWTVPDDIPLDCFVVQKNNGVSFKGNTYWLAFDNKYRPKFLLSFDFTTERFKPMCLPFESRDPLDIVSLSSGREERISVLYQKRDSLGMGVWVTTNDKSDDTGVLSWTKFLTVSYINCNHRCVFSSNISFFIDEEKNVAVCCDEIYKSGTITNVVYIIGEFTFREIPFGDAKRSWWPLIFNYVPSLVEIQRG